MCSSAPTFLFTQSRPLGSNKLVNLQSDKICICNTSLKKNGKSAPREYPFLYSIMHNLFKCVIYIGCIAQKWLNTVFKQSSKRLVAPETILRWLETVLRWLEIVLKWLDEVLHSLSYISFVWLSSYQYHHG